MFSLNNISLYRRRFIPDEKILLKDDELVSIDDEKIVTRWQVLTKRHDFTHGASCYYIKEGFKISKFLDEYNNLVYWYCDIIETKYNEKENSYTFNDLLIDVIIDTKGFVKVVDIDEIAVAMKKQLLTNEQIIFAMETTEKLLNIIYSGKFDKYSEVIKNI